MTTAAVTNAGILNPGDNDHTNEIIYPGVSPDRGSDTGWDTDHDTENHAHDHNQE